MRAYYGRPRGLRDGVRNSASELEGCLGAKISNPRCVFGCAIIVLLVALVAGIAFLVIKYGYHLF